MNAKLLQNLWQHFNHYKAWLSQQKMAAHTQRAYVSRLNQFLVFLATEDNSYEEVLKNERTRDRAVEDYKDYLKHHLKYNASTINTTLSTLDHFYRQLGLGEPNVSREELPKQMPNALTSEEVKNLIWAVDRSQSLRDRALLLLFLRAGLRVGECAALNLEDIDTAGEKITINIRSTKKNRARLIALDAETGSAVQAWVRRRALRFRDSKDQALFLSRLGKRITTAGIDLNLRKLGRAVGIEISAEVLRHTCLMNMLVSGKDVRQVKRLSGHKRLETTRRYSPPAITVLEDFTPPAANDVLPAISITPFEQTLT